MRETEVKEPCACPRVPGLGVAPPGFYPNMLHTTVNTKTHYVSVPCPSLLLFFHLTAMSCTLTLCAGSFTRPWDSTDSKRDDLKHLSRGMYTSPWAGAEMSQRGDGNFWCEPVGTWGTASREEVTELVKVLGVPLRRCEGKNGPGRGSSHCAKALGPVVASERGMERQRVCRP